MNEEEAKTVIGFFGCTGDYYYEIIMFSQFIKKFPEWKDLAIKELRQIGFSEEGIIKIVKGEIDE